MAAIEHQSDARLSAPEPRASNPHVSSWLPLRPADYRNLSPSQRERGTPSKNPAEHMETIAHKKTVLLDLDTHHQTLDTENWKYPNRRFPNRTGVFLKWFGNPCFLFPN